MTATLQNPDKATNHRRYAEGFYGNKLRVWSRAELLKSGYKGLVALRYNGRAGGTNYPKYCTLVGVPEALELFNEWVRLGAKPDLIFFGEAAPDHDLLIQGELMQSAEHYALFWTRSTRTDRGAFETAQQTYGLRALALLRTHMTPASFEDVQELLDLFPDHVIEFSTYRYTLGCCRGRNTIVWEVRNY